MKEWENGGLGLGEVLDYINEPYMSNVTALKDAAGTEYQHYKLV